MQCVVERLASLDTSYQLLLARLEGGGWATGGHGAGSRRVPEVRVACVVYTPSKSHFQSEAPCHPRPLSPFPAAGALPRPWRGGGGGRSRAYAGRTARQAAGGATPAPLAHIGDVQRPFRQFSPKDDFPGDDVRVRPGCGGHTLCHGPRTLPCTKGDCLATGCSSLLYIVAAIHVDELHGGDQ